MLRRVDYMKSVVTMVKELEGTEITIVPSTVGKIVPDGTPEEEWTWAVESLKEIHEHANKAGVVMAIEPLNRFETHFITPRRAGAWRWPMPWRPTSASASTAST